MAETYSNITWKTDVYRSFKHKKRGIVLLDFPRVLRIPILNEKTRTSKRFLVLRSTAKALQFNCWKSHLENGGDCTSTCSRVVAFDDGASDQILFKSDIVIGRKAVFFFQGFLQGFHERYIYTTHGGYVIAMNSLLEGNLVLIC